MKALIAMSGGVDSSVAALLAFPPAADFEFRIITQKTEEAIKSALDDYYTRKGINPKEQ